MRFFSRHLYFFIKMLFLQKKIYKKNNLIIAIKFDCAIIKTERKVIVLKTIECNDIKIVYGE